MELSFQAMQKAFGFYNNFILNMSNNKYVKLPIKGMHCRSCELLVEDGLKELPGVEKVEVNYSAGEATIHYQGEQPSDAALKKAVAKAGYVVGVDDVKPFFNSNTDNLLEIIIGASILFLFYLLLRGLGLTSIDFNPDTSEAGLALPLMVGLVAGVSTCMALVGGLVLGLSGKFSEKHPNATRLESFRPHLFFVGGRIIGYAFLGGVLGALGSVFQLSSVMNASLTMLVGALMLFIGLQLTNLFPRLSAMSISMPVSVSKFFGINKKQREYSHKHAAILGGLTFFLPCGFTQAMQVLAVSRGNFIEGALIMGLFALGTAPGLLSIGGLSSAAKGKFKNLFFKTAGVAIVFLSLFNLNNGYTLLASGFDFSDLGANNKNDDAVVDPNVVMENGVQVVRMTETNSGYSPNEFTIKKGVPVKWIVDAQAPYSCASVLGIPKLRLQKFLKAGENIIEFTPTEVGALKFSCSMGMYTGIFNVVDGPTSEIPSVTNKALADNTDAEVAPAPVNGGATCGANGGGCGCGGGKAPAKTNTPPVVAKTTQDAASQENIQVVKTVYTSDKYLDPSNFTVKAGTKVRMEIEVQDSGTGCGSQITIPGLADEVKDLQAGTTVVFEFTPSSKGLYSITCGMNMINFGTINVE